MRKMLIVLRAYSWPASLIPVLLGSVVAAGYGAFSWGDFALTVIAALAVHSGANLANTYFDFINGVDTHHLSDDRALVDGLIKLPTALYVSIALFSAAAALGIYIAITHRLPLLLALGALGFMLAWFYTAGGISYKYKALGDVGVFMAFGPLIVTCTALIQTGRVLPEAVLASIPVGLLIVAILHANNMRDLDSDKISGTKTLPGLLGIERSRTIYTALIFTPYLLALLAGLWPAVFAASSLPSAVKLNAMARGKDLSPLVRRTAGFVTVFGLLFSAGLWFR